MMPPPPLNIPLNYELDIDKIPVENGMLIFKDNVHFALAAKRIQKTKKEEPQFAARTENEPFISMKMAFDSINNHQGIIADSLELLETNNPGSVTEAIFNNTHSPLLQTFNNAYKIITMDDGGKYLELNTREYSIAEIINKDGFVQIGNKLHKVEYDTLKTMNNGTSSDFSTLDGAVTSDPSRGITVEIITNNGTIARTMGLPEYSALRKNCQSTAGKVRVVGNYDMILYLQNDEPPLTVLPSHRVRTLGLKRRLWGIWWDAPNNGTIGAGVWWNVIGNSSSGIFVVGNNSVGGSVSWTTTNSNSGSPVIEQHLSYNPSTQGDFLTQMLPTIYQAVTRHRAVAYKTNGVPLGSVECNCYH